MFLDGIERGATTTTTSSSGTLTDTARLYSTSRSLSGVGRFDGREGSIAIFDSILSAAEVLAIRNDGDIDFDLKANQGDYQSAANLVHWNPLGAKVSPLLGEDIA